MISTANITMQFGDKPLFEDISVNFGEGNRYGLIGANGSGKSTFMKILDGSLEPTAGNVSVTPNERIGKLSQDQFAYEEFSVIDTVIMGYVDGCWYSNWATFWSNEQSGTRLEVPCFTCSSFVFWSWYFNAWWANLFRMTAIF